MVFSYQERVIIKNLWTNFKYGATRIVNDHPEYEWKVHSVKKILKKIDETSDVARKGGSRQPKSVRT